MKSPLMVSTLILGALLVGTWILSPALILIGMGENFTPSFLGGTEDSTEVFRGYRAFLDDDIMISLIQGTSMRPTFDNNDSIFWFYGSIDDIELGDVIAFTHVPTVGPHKGQAFRSAHRVVRVGYGGVVAQGDNRLAADQIWITDRKLDGPLIGVLFTSSQAWGIS